MDEYLVGQIVYSKSGRDKRKLFIVSNVKDEYLYLIDGDLRKVEKPKKKKKKHVQPTKFINYTIRDLILQQKHILNSDVRKIILEYTRN